MQTQNPLRCASASDETLEQWQEVVDSAAALLQIHPSDRCLDLLMNGQRCGYLPSPGRVSRLVAAAKGSQALLEEMDRKQKVTGNRKSVFDNR